LATNLRQHLEKHPGATYVAAWRVAGGGWRVAVEHLRAYGEDETAARLPTRLSQIEPLTDPDRWP
jgi:hypothetical protein